MELILELRGALAAFWPIDAAQRIVDAQVSQDTAVLDRVVDDLRLYGDLVGLIIGKVAP